MSDENACWEHPLEPHAVGFAMGLGVVWLLCRFAGALGKNPDVLQQQLRW